MYYNEAILFKITLLIENYPIQATRFRVKYRLSDVTIRNANLETV